MKLFHFQADCEFEAEDLDDAFLQLADHFLALQDKEKWLSVRQSEPLGIDEPHELHHNGSIRLEER